MPRLNAGKEVPAPPPKPPGAPALRIARMPGTSTTTYMNQMRSPCRFTTTWDEPPKWGSAPKDCVVASIAKLVCLTYLKRKYVISAPLCRRASMPPRAMSWRTMPSVLPAEALESVYPLMIVGART
jgi:hypothetical protein